MAQRTAGTLSNARTPSTRLAEHIVDRFSISPKSEVSARIESPRLSAAETRSAVTTIGVMAESDPASGPHESLPWSLLPEPPGLTALDAAMRDLDEAMQPSTPLVESVRLLESASLGIYDVANRIEEYLPEAEATLTLSLRGRCHDPVAAAAGAAADRMLAGMRHLADASRAFAATLDDPDVDDSAAERKLHTARADAFTSLRALIEEAS